MSEIYQEIKFITNDDIIIAGVKGCKFGSDAIVYGDGEVFKYYGDISAVIRAIDAGASVRLTESNMSIYVPDQSRVAEIRRSIAKKEKEIEILKEELKDFIGE